MADAPAFHKAHERDEPDAGCARSDWATMRACVSHECDAGGTFPDHCLEQQLTARAFAVTVAHPSGQADLAGPDEDRSERCAEAGRTGPGQLVAGDLDSGSRAEGWILRNGLSSALTVYPVDEGRSRVGASLGSSHRTRPGAW